MFVRYSLGAGMKLGVLGAAVAGGVVAGFFDIGAAMAIYHVPAGPVLRAIARGLVGSRPLSPGVQLLGFFLQLFMGGLIGLVYGLGALRSPRVASQWITAGLAYGLVVFLVMNYVVVPLSAVHTMPSFTVRQAVLNVAAMLAFGLIVAFAASRGQPAGETAEAA